LRKIRTIIIVTRVFPDGKIPPDQVSFQATVVLEGEKHKILKDGSCVFLYQYSPTPKEVANSLSVGVEKRINRELLPDEYEIIENAVTKRMKGLY